MKFEVLIITSGGSQLISQIAALNSISINRQIVSVIYNGVFRKDLDDFLISVCDFFSFDYIGSINFNLQPNQISQYKNLLFYLTGHHPLEKEIRKNFSILCDYRFLDLVSIPIRVKMPQDSVLLSYLLPKRVQYVADGVIDNVPHRNLKKKTPFVLNRFLSKFPVNEKIYTPNHLVNDLRKVGKPHVVDLKTTLGQFSKIPLVKSYESWFVVEKPDAIIFSQHYSLTEDVSLDQEVNFYKAIGASLYRDGCKRILFKPHPRDLNEKIEVLKLRNDNLFIFQPQCFQGLPIEVLYNTIKEEQVICATGNSSAPLFFKSTNTVLTFSSRKYLSNELNFKISSFSNEHQLAQKDI